MDAWLSWCDEVALSYRSSSQRVAGRNNSRFGGPLKRRNWGWFSTRVDKHFMFETTSEARHLHSCSALEAAFFLPIFFSSLSCECNWKHAAARVMSSELYQNRIPNAPICWFAAWYIPYVTYLCICMNPKEKAHPFFYVLTMQKIYISRLSVTTKKSRTPPVPRPLGAMAKAKLAKLDAAHLKRGPNQKGFG